MSEERANTTTKTPKLRSPNYPFIGLEEALNRLRSINELGRGHFVPVTAAREKWGYQQVAGDRTVAALKAYGLVEVIGESEKRQLKPTEQGSKILENHSQKTELIKSAALTPALHAEIWSKYNGNLPDNAVIKEYLRWEKKFNPDNINKFLKQFRGTITFASLADGDIMDAEGGGADDEDAVHDTNANQHTNTGGGTGTSGKLVTPVLGKGVVFNITIDVLENGQINVVNGGTLDSDTFAILSDVFELKKKHEKQPETKGEDIYDPTTGEEPGRMN